MSCSVLGHDSLVNPPISCQADIPVFFVIEREALCIYSAGSVIWPRVFVCGNMLEIAETISYS